jgi:hypothetical protein
VVIRRIWCFQSSVCGLQRRIAYRWAERGARLVAGTGGADYALLRVAITINFSGSVDPTAGGSRLLFLMLYAAMVRAGSIVMLAETIGSIAA